ncbi:LolA-like protein [Streptomyces sp. NPDC001985]|uniref:hypothetical protein n=1 Tax=Streptomyces sp. NPDC001985 TaxID=3154406 RepID=UPI00333467A0
MKAKTIRCLAVSAAVAAALTSVAACGGSDGEGSGKKSDGLENGGLLKADPIAALRDVQAKTGGADSAKIEGTTVMGEMMSMKQAGAIDWSDGLSGTMDITYTGGTMAETMKQSGVTGPMETRYFKDGYVVNMGETVARQMNGKPWISYTYDDLAAMAGPSGSVLKDQLQNSTPQQAVKALLASGDVKKAGEESVRGVSATRYSGTIDVAELSTANSELGAKELETFKKQLATAGITTQKVDIWVDKENLLVKKVESGKMKTGSFNSTVFYSDYGTKVSAERPPASETVEFKELMKQGGSSPAASS